MPSTVFTDKWMSTPRSLLDALTEIHTSCKLWFAYIKLLEKNDPQWSPDTCKTLYDAIAVWYSVARGLSENSIKSETFRGLCEEKLVSIRNNLVQARTAAGMLATEGTPVSQRSNLRKKVRAHLAEAYGCMKQSEFYATM